MSYIVTRPQWLALKSIAGTRRTVAATAAHIPHQTRSCLLRQRWIEYTSDGGPNAYYRVTPAGRRMLKLATKHYTPPRKRKEKRRSLLSLEDLKRGIPRYRDPDLEGYIGSLGMLHLDVPRYISENSPDQAKNAAGRAAGASRGDEAPVLPGSTTCGRKAETPGYLPCRRPPHTEGPCSHELSAKAAIEMLKQGGAASDEVWVEFALNSPEFRDLAIDRETGARIYRNALAACRQIEAERRAEVKAREFGAAKYGPPNYSGPGVPPLGSPQWLEHASTEYAAHKLETNRPHPTVHHELVPGWNAAIKFFRNGGKL